MTLCSAYSTARGALWQAGLPCPLTNPKAARRFAEAMGLLEKTDLSDAEVIARHAAARRTQPTQLSFRQQRLLTALAAQLRQVTSDLLVEKQQLHITRDPMALASLREAVVFFTAQAKALAAQFAALVKHDPVWTPLDRSFRSVKGVADRTVAVLLASIAHYNGTRSGKRSTRSGRTAVRSPLYLVADVARKYGPTLADFRQRLLDSGKPKIVVRIIPAPKLPVCLKAKAREPRPVLAS